MSSVSFLVTMFCEARGERWEGWVDAASPEEALQKWCRRKSVVRSFLSELPWQFVVYDEISGKEHIARDNERRRIEYEEKMAAIRTSALR